MDRSFGSGSIHILSARFELLHGAAAHGWMVRVSGGAQYILHRAAPFVARVGEQRLESLGVNAEGSAFEGFLRQVPKPGDRLHVGYATANTPTAFTFRTGPDTVG